MAGASRLAYVARVGHGARGAVYLLVGGFALTAAIRGGRATGSREALSEMLKAPGGKVLVVATGVGLLAFAAWRALQAIFDPEERGWGRRASYLGSGLTHLLLGLFAFSIALVWGPSAGGDEESTRHWTAWLMSKPLGRWVLGLVGCGIAGKSAQQFIQAFRGNFDNRGSLERQARWAVPVARAGLTARGAVFAIIAIFCIVASLRADPSEARGLEGALTFIQEQPYGPWLLGITGAGLIAFSAYAFLEAVFGRFPVPREVHDALEG